MRDNMWILKKSVPNHQLHHHCLFCARHLILQDLYYHTIPSQILPRTLCPISLCIALNMTTCHYRARRPGSRAMYSSIWTHLIHHLDEFGRKFLNNITNIDDEDIYQFHNIGLSDLALQRNYLNSGVNRMIENYFHTFNRMFFFGAFNQELYTLRFVHEGDIEWQTNRERTIPSAGHTQRRKSWALYRETIKCTITIYDKTWDAEYCLKSYIGTLLHEMVHAFIMTFTCSCESCNERFAREYGVRGHGET